MQGNWVVEIGWHVSRTDVAGDVCLRRPRTTQGRRANDDDKVTWSYSDAVIRPRNKINFINTV
jgi:hypothetical protein